MIYDKKFVVVVPDVPRSVIEEMPNTLTLNC